MPVTDHTPPAVVKYRQNLHNYPTDRSTETRGGEYGVIRGQAALDYNSELLLRHNLRPPGVVEDLSFQNDC